MSIFLGMLFLTWNAAWGWSAYYSVLQDIQYWPEYAAFRDAERCFDKTGNETYTDLMSDNLDGYDSFLEWSFMTWLSVVFLLAPWMFLTVEACVSRRKRSKPKVQNVHEVVPEAVEYIPLAADPDE